MAQNAYSPPAAPVKDHEPDRAIAEKPKQVIYAVWLLWLAIPLGIPGSIYEYQRMPEDQQGLGFLVFYVALYVFAMVLNIFISRGHNWARILTLFFFVVAFATYAALFNEYSTYPFVPLASNIIVLILEVIAVYLLFTNPGKLWFRHAP
jgi:hypothetical protein